MMPEKCKDKNTENPFRRAASKAAACLLALLLSFSAVSCKNVAETEAFKETDFYFDTSVTITLYGESKEYLSGCMELCEKYSDMLDRFDEESEIYALNTDGSASVSKEVTELIKLSEEYCAFGKFDIKIAPFLALWGFDDDKLNIPKDEDIDALLEKYKGFTCNYDEQTQTVTLSEGCKIDFGGIAKGYAADKIAAYLKENGVASGLLSLGSSTMVLIGSKPDGDDYSIALQTPFESEGTYDYLFEGSNCSISSSGAYERYFEEDGIIYHQIIDPDTGRPAESDINGVTVISDSAARSDVLSTEIYILGLSEGLDYAESLEGVEAIFFDEDNNVTLTSGLTLSENNIITPAR